MSRKTCFGHRCISCDCLSRQRGVKQAGGRLLQVSFDDGKVRLRKFLCTAGRYTRVKVIHAEVSQNVVHARTKGWMTSTRPIGPGKLRDFGLQWPGSNPGRGTCFELLEWNACRFLKIGGQAKCNPVLFVVFWPFLIVFRAVIWLWAKKHEFFEVSGIVFEFAQSADQLFHCGKLDGVCSSSTDLKSITRFFDKWREAHFSSLIPMVPKNKRKEKDFP